MFVKNMIYFKNNRLTVIFLFLNKLQNYIVNKNVNKCNRPIGGLKWNTYKFVHINFKIKQT